MPSIPRTLSLFWKELKRRKVIRGITVYAAAAFVILELTDILAPSLGLPAWTLNFTLVVLCLGFVVAVILSWIYDVHPDGGLIKTKPRLKTGEQEEVADHTGWRIGASVSVVVILGLIVINIVGILKGVKIDETLEKSIAVLPIHNMSGDPGLDYVTEGLTDEIINQLYKIGSFDKVVSLTSVLNYKNPNKSITEIADELKVNYILEGTYKRIGDQFKVTAQLIEPKNDKHIWQQDYNRSSNEIVSLQSDIALKIGYQLKAFITKQEKRSIEKNLTLDKEAWEKYQLANYFFRRSSGKGNLQAALELYKESIKLDKEFALAYISLARCYLNMYWFYYDRSQVPFLASQKAIEKAYQIDPYLPEVYIARAEYLYHGQLDYQGALDQLKKASEYLSVHPDYHRVAALVYRRMGEWSRSINEFNSAREIDPESPWILQNLADTYISVGMYREAIECLDIARRNNPEDVMNYELRMNACLLRDGHTGEVRLIMSEAAAIMSEEVLMNQLVFISPVWIDICDGKYREVLHGLSGSTWKGHVNLVRYHPRNLFQAMLYDLIQIPEVADQYYDSVRIDVEQKLREYPDDPRYMGTLGIAFAGLGKKQQALQSVRQAVDFYSLKKDAYFGLFRVEELAWVYVMVEEYELALEQIEVLLSRPGPYSAPFLKLDPKWKPLWDHPEFIGLTEKYAITE